MKYVALKPLTRFKLFYLTYFFGLSMTAPFFSLFLSSIGWQNSFIGASNLTQRIVSFLAQPAIGMLADKTEQVCVPRDIWLCGNSKYFKN
jgi:hypothetical protein